MLPLQFSGDMFGKATCIESWHVSCSSEGGLPLHLLLPSHVQSLELSLQTTTDCFSKKKRQLIKAKQNASLFQVLYECIVTFKVPGLFVDVVLEDQFADN